MRWFLAFLCAGACSFLWLDGDRPACAQDKVPPSVANLASGNKRIVARRFHTILLADTNDPRHEAAERSLRYVETVINNTFTVSLLEEAKKGQVFLPDRFAISTPTIRLVGPQCSQADLDAVLEELRKPQPSRFGIRQPVQPGDVVFFWGESEGLRNGQTDYLVFNNGDRIDRAQLKHKLEFPDALGKQTTTLTVFITDHCRTVGNPRDLGGRNGSSGIWRALYFGHHGTVDLSSAEPERPAFANGGISFFAEAFSRSFFNPDDPQTLPALLLKDVLDRPDAGVVGVVEWKDEFLPHLQLQTQKVFDAELDRLTRAGRKEDADKLRAAGGQRPVINDLNAVRVNGQ